MFFKLSKKIKYTTLILSTIVCSNLPTQAVHADTNLLDQLDPSIQLERSIQSMKQYQLQLNQEVKKDIKYRQQMIIESVNSIQNIQNIEFVETFAQQTVGQSIDMDGWYGAQCYDLANYYLQKLGSTGISGGSSRAGYIGTEFKDKFISEGLTVIENPTSSDFKAGDLISITPSDDNDPYYGHVAVIKSVNKDGTIVTLEQNAEQGQIVAEYTRTFPDGTISSIVRK